MVFDNEGKAVAKITSGHLGMGVFDFIPEAGRTYKAKVTFANGSQSAVDLPIVQAKGITLDVLNSDPNKISIEINANRDYYKENQNKDLNMIVYCAGKVRTYSFKLDNEVLGLDLPVKDFSTGILQVTLLSGTGEPMNERMVFIQNSDQLNISVTTNKTLFAKRENVQLSLNAKTNEGMPVNGNFSVSVVDESKVLVDEDSENTILSYLLLTSDLKGYIEKPNYYFAHDSKETRNDLDALMLTQGYRRFVWKQLLNDNFATTAAFTPEKHIDIAGTLKTKAGAPITNSNILLIEKVSGTTLIQQTDAQGHFRFADMDFSGSTRFLLKMQSPSEKNGAVVTLDPPAPGPAVNPANLIESKYNAGADILASMQGNQGTSFVTASNASTKLLLQNDKTVETRSDNNYRSSKLGGSGSADQVIRADQILPGPSLTNSLKGVARGIDFSNGVAYLQNSMIVNAGKMGTEPMLIIEDGSVASNIDDVNPSDVETVEILKGINSSIYGVRGAAGVIVINTKQTTSPIKIGREMAPGLFAIAPAGFYKATEFYSPRYDASQPGNQLPDTRTTIFWKPDAATDANGNVLFNYFNADGAGSYRVEVEGIDSKGNLGRQVYRYKVQ